MTIYGPLLSFSYILWKVGLVSEQYDMAFQHTHTASENGHGLTEIAQLFCLFIYQFEIANKQNLQKSKYIDDPFFYKSS